jgi:large repetitive protein
VIGQRSSRFAEHRKPPFQSLLKAERVLKRVGSSDERLSAVLTGLDNELSIDVLMKPDQPALNLAQQFAAGSARACAWLLVLFFMCLSISAHAARPNAGDVINNTAFVSYTTTTTTITNFPSNTVAVRVEQVASFTLTSSQSVTSAPGTTISFPHTLLNTGNGPDVFDLSIVNIATGTFNFVSVTLYADTSPQDGVADNLVPITQTPTLAPGQSYTFVAVAVVPTAPGAVAGQLDSLSVTAVGNPTVASNGSYVASAAQTNFDTVTVTANAVIAPAGKSFSIISGPSPSANNIRTTLTYTNNSAATATNLLITDEINKVLLSPAINTTGFRYVAGSARWSSCGGGATPLTDANDGYECGPVGQRIDFRIIPGVATGEARVEALIESVPAFTSGQLTFELTVTSGIPAGTAQTTNAARMTYFDGAGNRTVDTNAATYNVLAATPGPDLRVAKTGPATVTVGNIATYSLQVSNNGNANTSATVTLTDTLPPGIQYAGMNGAGWTCSAGAFAPPASQIVTCTYAATVLSTSNAPPLLIGIIPRAGALLAPNVQGACTYGNQRTVTNSATVSGGGEPAANVNAQNTSTAASCAGPAANVSGRVWQDVNHNRLYNAGTDVDLSGWTVELVNPTTLAVIASTTTSTAGTYAINGVPPDNYGIRFRDPASGIVNGRPVCDNTAAAATGVSPGTGSYVSANCRAASFSGNQSQLNNDGSMLLVNLLPGDTIVEQNLPLDPSGIVYDAQSGAAVQGATVNLTIRRITDNAVAPGFNAATMLVGGAAAVNQVTGPTGFYQYILTAAGTAFCNGLPGGGCLLDITVSSVPGGYLPFSQSLVSYPPQASFGGCLATNCIDPTGLGSPYLVSPINVAPILPVGQPYYLRFFLSPGDPDVVNNHFPLIRTNAGGANLIVQKTASRTTVELGDFLDYTVRVSNGTAVAANPTTLIDRLPAGFKYVPGTARLSSPTGAARVGIADPAGGAGPVLNFNLGNIAAGNSAELTYRVQVSINGREGDGINRVTASAPGLNSNEANARVRVLGGVFSERGFIFGTVYLDCNRDRVQGDREPGIPGVRLFLQDGTTVVTDAEGKYSIYGVVPRTHVVKLDPITLPKGSELIALNNRNAGDPGSRFADVKKGELHRADFAEGSCAPEVLADVKARREKGETGAAELTRNFRAALAPTVTAPTTGNTQVPAASGNAVGSGASQAVVSPSVNPVPSTGAQGSAPAPTQRPTEATPFVSAPASGPKPIPDPAIRENPLKESAGGAFSSPRAEGPAQDVNGTNSNVPNVTGEVGSGQQPPVIGSVSALATIDLEKYLPTADRTLKILNLKDGDTLSFTQTAIQVQGAVGADFILSVNGETVPPTRVGKRSTMAERGVMGWDYIGVQMRPGVNDVRVRQVDSFGNTRGDVSIKVTAPGSFARIVLEAVESGVADGSTPVDVRVRLTDDKGVPVTARTAVTLETSLGRLEVQDLNATEPGVQTFITGGSAVFRLMPPGTPGEAMIRVLGGNTRTERKIAFLPHLRPLVGAGIIEGAFNFNNLSLKNLQTARTRDGFEQEIRRFHYESSDGKRDAAARAAFFLKGKVKGDYLLTLAYDSDKDLRERVFRDISPDEFYPIYGDSSARSFDGQTSGRFFVRVDKGKSFVLYGDYGTSVANPARQLSQYSRTLTGAKWHVEDSRVNLNAFASRDTFRQRVEEIAPNGTSGPFLLNIPSGAVINSERVEILTRDRNQPATILKAEPLGRFSDYDIDIYSGRLLFKGPISSFDSNLNPQSIRITYEIDQGGQAFWIGGVDGQVKLNDRVEIGGAFVRDQNPGGQFTMGGVNTTIRITDKTVAIAEFARTDRQAPVITPGTGVAGIAGQGSAGRVEIRHADGPLDIRAYAGRADVNFDNPSSTLNRGRAEAGVRANVKVLPNMTVGVDAIRTEDLNSNATRDSMQLRGDYTFANGIRVETGLRHSRELTPATADANANALSPSTGTTPNEFTSGRVRVTAPVPGIKDASVFGEYEQSFRGDDRRAYSVGTEYRIAQFGRLYLRHNVVNSLSGANGLNSQQRDSTTIIGADTRLSQNTQAFTEYRARSSLDTGTAEAALGLRNTWPLAEGLRVNTTFERLQPISRAAGNLVSTESTAVTGGIEYSANPLWRGSARLELRNSTAQNAVLSSLAGALRVNRDVSLLARGNYTYTEVKATPTSTGGEREQVRLQLGAAYRSTDSNQLSALARVEQRYERDTTVAIPLKRAVSLASVHFNLQPERSWILNGRYATKFVLEDSDGLRSTSSGHLMSGRLTYDVTSKWDVGVTTSLHTDGAFGNRKLGLGVEVGYLLYENMWVSAGYNIFGFKDRDLQGQDYTERGFYLRLRYKFDETLFDWKRDAPLREGPVSK